ncbi:hypothetical protein HNR06_002588 [Nocardiopsis arvandica]|uniref:Uncharacterized protein n=1 Tax=Nocardiopsis sinuspersici TaxID=501010 RepID=A0A7Z0BL35_9ACTN|nr:hypothetical protein [Nocardiopsis sinuspersici]NYH52999.1 hypothetical protein [Nocardiopsis sinuspersici]
MLTAAQVVHGHALTGVLTGVAAVCTAIASIHGYQQAHREPMNHSSESTVHSLYAIVGVPSAATFTSVKTCGRSAGGVLLEANKVIAFREGERP